MKYKRIVFLIALMTALALLIAFVSFALAASMVHTESYAIPFTENFDAASPCEPAGHWDCLGNDAVFIHQSNNSTTWVNISQGGFQIRTNLTGANAESLHIDINSFEGQAGGGDFRSEIRLNNNESAVYNGGTVFKMVFRGTGLSDFQCGTNLTAINDLVYGVWGIYLVLFASGLRCYAHHAGSYFVMNDTAYHEPLTNLTYLWLTNQGGSTSSWWIDYITLRGGEYSSDPTCSYFGYCGNTVPDIVTRAAVAGDTYAKFNGELMTIPGDVSAVTVWFQIGSNLTELGSYSASSWYNSTPREVKVAIGAFQITLSNLTRNTTYYFRAIGNGTGTAAGASLSFTTGGCNLCPGDPALAYSQAVNLFWLLIYVAILTLMVVGAWRVRDWRGGD